MKTREIKSRIVGSAKSERHSAIRWTKTSGNPSPKKENSEFRRLKLSRMFRSRKTAIRSKANMLLTAANHQRNCWMPRYPHRGLRRTFGDWFWRTPYFHQWKTYKGRKSGITGIGFWSLDKDGALPSSQLNQVRNWGNSSSKLLKWFPWLKTAKKKKTFAGQVI